MSTDIILSKDQSLGNLGMKALINIVIPLARDILRGLVSNLTWNIIYLKEKYLEKELTEQEKDLLYLFQMKMWILINLWNH